MKSKQLLKFYFAADKLEKALDNMIYANAYKSGVDFMRGGEFYAERMCTLIEVKERLNRLWQYLDGVIGGMNESDRAALECYARLRTGIARLEDSDRKAIKRAVIKFVRRARYIERYSLSYTDLKKYYCLLG